MKTSALSRPSTPEKLNEEIQKTLNETNLPQIMNPAMPEADVNQANENEFISLQIAVENRDTATVQALIAAGADVNQVDEDGSTPLSVAVENGDIATVRALIAVEADVNQVDGDGFTPLGIAEIKCRDDGFNPLEIAERQCRNEIATLLRGSLPAAGESPSLQPTFLEIDVPENVEEEREKFPDIDVPENVEEEREKEEFLTESATESGNSMATTIARRQRKPTGVVGGAVAGPAATSEKCCVII